MNEHLTPKTAEKLKLSDKERISIIQSPQWIPYTKSKIILEKMEDLLHYPQSDRMPNLLIIGDTNNGKTALLRKFARKNEPYPNPEDGSMRWPVLYIQAPVEPDERRFYNLILDEVMTPYKLNERVDKKQREVITIIRNMEVKVLIIDEIQHILAGSPNKQRLFLNMIKFLSNELRIPFIGAGIRTAMNAIQNDEQLSNRFEPAILPGWSMGNEYDRLLQSFENILPLKKPSNLIEDHIANKILSMSDGLIGEISKIIKKAAVMAIQNKSESITLASLDKIDFIPSTERMKYQPN